MKFANNTLFEKKNNSVKSILVNQGVRCCLLNQIAQITQLLSTLVCCHGKPNRFRLLNAYTNVALYQIITVPNGV